MRQLTHVVFIALYLKHYTTKAILKHTGADKRFKMISYDASVNRA